MSLNWTSGEIGFALLNVSLPWVRAGAASPYAPWILQVGFPIGAALFLVRHGRRRARVEAEPQPPAAAAWPPTGPAAP